MFLPGIRYIVFYLKLAICCLLLFQFAEAQPPTKQIITAEYFWDVDPGQGAGTLLLAIDGSLDEAIESVFENGITLPAPLGPHVFSVRVKDTDNQWGAVFSTLVERDNVEAFARNINVTQAEYFWDVDPGQGNGTPMLALDGNLDETIESVFETGIALPAPLGPHVFSVRVKDTDNQWGAVFSTLVERDNVEPFARNINVTQAEYFWDVDPGQGNGTPMLALDGNLNETIESVFKTGIALPALLGPHVFSVRVKDTDNQWGAVFSTLVERDNVEAFARNINVTQAEYFWDVDPGMGNGSTILALDGNLNESIETVFEDGLLNPGSGDHTFNIRVQDADNNWGALFSTAIHIVPVLTSMKIIQAEYFWDSDPGQGLGTTMLALDGNLDETIESVFKDGIVLPAAPGPHTFNVRVRDSDNQWGYVFSTLVEKGSVEPSSRSLQVMRAEYFWDVDPGMGNGSTILALDGNLNESIETVFGSGLLSPGSGDHTFNIRVQDADNNWGGLFSTAIHIEPVFANMKIIQAEYFWDSDPGQGFGTTMLALDGNLEETIESVFQNGIVLPATPGPHTFHVRVRDSYNQWGFVFSTLVVKGSLESSSRSMQVMQAEYFWDTDPGQGNGTPMLALDGNLDETIESVFEYGIALPAPLGPHVFSVRVKDADNQWGPVFSTLVERNNVEEATRNIVVTQAEYFWDVDPGQGNGTPMLAMDGNLDEVIESVFEYGIALPAPLGPHVFHVRVKDADNQWGPVFSTLVERDNVEAFARNIHVLQAEYFWDVDPGQGAGAPILALDGNLNESIESIFNTGIHLPVGGSAHVFNIRVKEGDNQWSPLFSTVVSIDCPIAGTPCDDDDSCTSNDQEDGNCNCAGTPSIDTDSDGLCDDRDNDDDNDGVADGFDTDPLDPFVCEDMDYDGCDDCSIGVDGFGPLPDNDPNNDDNTPPTAICKDITVQLDLGFYYLFPEEVDDGSFDNCSIAYTELDIYFFECSDIGINTVVLTVSDFDFNTDECTANVTVLDDNNTCCPPANTPCDDGNACTENDIFDGDCKCAGTPLDCDDGDPCTFDYCDPAYGCLPSNPYDCEDGNPCTVDLCDLDAYQNISYYFTQEENTLCNPEAMFEIEVHSTVGGPEGDLLDIITFLFMQDGVPDDEGDGCDHWTIYDDLGNEITELYGSATEGNGYDISYVLLPGSYTICRTECCDNPNDPTSVEIYCADFSVDAAICQHIFDCSYDEQLCCDDWDPCTSEICVDGSCVYSPEPDSDNDGLCDIVDPCPLDPLDDIDGDGLCADVDNCPSVFNPNQTDSDGDGQGDACDACPFDADNDIDNDGVCADVDNCPATANTDQSDQDMDGTGDACDICPLDPTDDGSDGDGVCDDVDNCVAVPNPSQTDTDGDGQGDACDICPFDAFDDIDDDGVCGDVDNCPTDPNSGQADTDMDGIGDVCDMCPLDPTDDGSDGDGVCDDVDNCLGLANPSQTDTDLDGTGDACDICPLDPTDDASDNDGVCDDIDNCLGLANPSQTDTDGDGLGDACDPDDDNDGCLDIDDPLPLTFSPDTDGDGEGNDCDADDDNDGVADINDIDPLDPTVCEDVDNDGCDDCSNLVDGFGALPDNNPLNDGLDTDGDGLCNAGDADDDNDGCLDAVDPQPLQFSVDTDNDGVGDDCDICPFDPTDDASDNDGVCDDVDNCLGLANPSQTDTDLDGTGDACDICPLDPTDDASDSDGVCDDIDNCVGLANPSQTDTDGDGLGDACDLDDDNDGCLDIDDPLPLTFSPDTDGDGEGNDCDADDDNDGVADINDSDPLDPTVCEDVDNDGCDDCSNLVDGFGALPDNNPLNDGLDTDGDGLCNTGDPDDDNDGCLDAVDPQPLQFSADTDNDGFGDDCDICPFDPTDDASDNDGVCDDVDNCLGLANPSQTDTDLDGTGDACDICPLDPTDDASDNDGVCDDIDNCVGLANPSQTDTDGDGLGDACDPDDDNDGCLDSVDPLPLNFSVDTDGDGQGNDCDTDDDNDGCLDIDDPLPLTFSPDTDGDGEGNDCDADDDNDGVADINDIDPLDPTVCEDVDNDGCDDCSNLVDGFGALPDNNPLNDGLDTDGDGLCNAGDPDDDNDGCLDAVDPQPLQFSADTDTDNDGFGDDCDICPFDPTDDASDNDGVCDDVDNCLGLANPSQTDTDLDGTGDACDICPLDPTDDASDNDGVCDDIDNCVGLANPSQTDTDGDGLGDACDPDDDNDGCLDSVDPLPLNFSVDTDGDGQGNDCDTDDDNDGCLDIDDPLPLTFSPDTDGDGEGNDCDADDDNDGVADINDIDPLDPTVCEDVDNDGCDDCSVTVDGFGSLPDNDPNDDGVDADGDGICGNTDCDDNNPDVYPGAPEICDGLDNDCNELVDDTAVPCCEPANTPCDDGNACTTNDIEDGNCNCAGTPLDCDDDDPCTIDECDPGAAQNTTYYYSFVEHIDCDPAAEFTLEVWDGAGGPYMDIATNLLAFDSNPDNSEEDCDYWTIYDDVGNEIVRVYGSDISGGNGYDITYVLPQGNYTICRTECCDNPNSPESVEIYCADFFSALTTVCQHTLDCSIDPQACCDDGDICNGIEICDANGNCQPGIPEPDTDGDGECDPIDQDDDNDGCQDAFDPNPLTFSPDTDGDGVADDCDLDDDNDGCLDVDDANPLVASIDSDNDGLADDCDDCPNDPDNDIDDDGVCGDEDNCTLTANTDQLDSDGDGQGDACDICPFDAFDDIDADGVCGDVDNCPFDPNNGQADTDLDGIGDVCDICPNDPTDDGSDGDGICDDVDNCVGVANTDQSDIDMDGTGDVCDICPFDPTDDGSDNDGVCDDIDNCLGLANPSQTDTDGDGQGDACDNDDDNDGCPDNVDPLPLIAGVDTDGDGIADECDGDDDNDGVPDIDDPDPIDPFICGDADLDLCDDCIIGIDGIGPLPDGNPLNDGLDTDGDGLCDLGDPDDDNDGVGDPNDPNTTDPSICGDSDGDGCDDCTNLVDGFGPLVDSDPSNDGTDTDGDGICDSGDPCFGDNSTGDTDSDGLCNDVDQDDDNDGCQDAFDPNPLTFSPDTDGDGVADDCDPCPASNPDDADGDGICDDIDPCLPNDDNELPIALCHDITIELDDAGSAVLTPSEVDAGSSDNCGIDQLFFDNAPVLNLDCEDVGTVHTEIVAMDLSGNLSLPCPVVIEVFDLVAPVALCKDLTIGLDPNGDASITPEDIDDGSNDACDIASLNIDHDEFSCSDAVPIVSSTQDVFISEYIEGTSYNKCIEIYNGTGAIVDLAAGNYRMLIYYNGNTTAGDDIALSGNIADGDVFVICHSNTDAAFLAQADQTSTAVLYNGNDAVVLSKNGTDIDIFGKIGQNPGSGWFASGNLTTNQTLIRNMSVLSGNTDNAFGFPSLATEWTQFPINDVSHLGAHIAAGPAPVNVTLTVTDNNGNSSTCTATVTVEDNVAPTALCQDVTVELDASGNATVTPEDADAGSSDNCGIDHLFIDGIPSLDLGCEDAGTFHTEIVAMDLSGNLSQPCFLSIDIQDNIPPEALCQNVTLQLDANGVASLDPEDVDNGSFDNCGIVSISLDQTEFDCSLDPSIGLSALNPGRDCGHILFHGNGVSGTYWIDPDRSGPNAPFECYCDMVTDDGGWTLVANQTGTDDWMPFDSDLDPDISFGTYSPTWDQTTHYYLNHADIEHDQIMFKTGDGTAWLVLDATCARTVNTDPNALNCEIISSFGTGLSSGDYTNVYLDPSDPHTPFIGGEGTLADNLTKLFWAEASFESFKNWVNTHGGDVAIFIGNSAPNDNYNPDGTFSVTDIGGNSDICTVEITLVDDIPPLSQCQDITVDLDDDGNATAEPEDADAGSSDNCGIDQFFFNDVPFIDFGCEDVGTFQTEIVAMDLSGNLSESCIVTIEVRDVTPPEVFCHDLTVELDESGTATVMPEDVVDPASGDNCGIDQLFIDGVAFLDVDCDDVEEAGGTIATEIVAMDLSGNPSNPCEVTILVREIILPQTLCPPDITIQCDQINLPSNTGFGSCQDNCGVISPSAAYSDVILARNCPSEYTIERTWTCIDGSGNSSNCLQIITAEDIIAPLLSCPPDITVGISESLDPLYIGHAQCQDNCGTSTLSFSPTPLFIPDCGTTFTREWTCSDECGNQSNCFQQITVFDDIRPIVNCVDITVFLDLSGIATVEPEDADDGSSDNCGIDQLFIDGVPSLDLGCEDVGTFDTEIIAMDLSGNFSQPCFLSVDIQDNEDPVITCPADIIVDNDPGICGAMVSYPEPAVTDNCDVTFTNEELIFDFSGDVQAFVVPAGVTSINVDARGAQGGDNSFGPQGGKGARVNTTLSVTPGEILNIYVGGEGAGTSMDHIGRPGGYNGGGNGGDGDVGVVNPSCCAGAGGGGRSDIRQGGTMLDDRVISAGGGGGASGSGDALTIGFGGDGGESGSDGSDGSPPVTGGGGGTLTEDGFGGISVSGYGNAGSGVGGSGGPGGFGGTGGGGGGGGGGHGGGGGGANIPNEISGGGGGGSSYSVNPANFESGYQSDDGSIIITWAVAVYILSPNQEDGLGSNSIFPVGTTIEEFTVTDASGNSASCSFNVTVNDTEPPIALCQDIVVTLDADGNATVTPEDADAGSSDNCGIAELFFTGGVHFIDLSCNDTEQTFDTEIVALGLNGLESDLCTVSITVIDDIPPLSQCQDLTVALDGSGNATVTPEDADNGSSDACGIDHILINQAPFINFGCEDVGTFDTEIIAMDLSGNPSPPCFFSIEMIDNIEPNAVCRNLTVQLDASGNGSITAASLDNGSNDPCGIASLTGMPVIFNCANIGANTATLTVTDNNGNASTCTGTVTVQDNVAPTAACRNITIQLNAAGNANITAPNLNNGSSDVCGLASLSATPTAYDCGDVGTNTATLTVTDNNGNVSTCTGTVTVQDNVAPVSVCQDITVQLDANGTVTFSTLLFDGGSTDNCGLIFPDNPISLNCNHVGSFQINVPFEDINGNPNTVEEISGTVVTCRPTITVEDNVAPEAKCKDLTITLDALGNYALSAGEVDDGSSDNCAISNMTVSPSIFTCSDIGDNTVTLTVTDVSSNSTSCNSTVTVIGDVFDVTIEESEHPIFCQDGSLILTAISVEAVSYFWDTDPGQGSQSILVTENGTYTVTVTSATGCTATASHTVSGIDSGSLLSAFTILGQDEVHLHGDNVVGSGGVGVIKAGKMAKLHENAQVLTFVKAPIVEITGTSAAASVILAQAGVVLPPFYSNPYTSTNNVPVAENAVVTLTDCIYDKIDIKKNATVTFTCANIFIHELKMKEGVTINFSGSANMFINKKVKIEKNSHFNPAGDYVMVYVDEKFEVKEGSDVHAIVYATKDVKADGKNSLVEMNGLFIGKKVDGKKQVTWNWNTTCDPAELPDLPEPCDNCKGGVTQMDLIYNGLVPVFVEVTGKDGQPVYFSGMVNPGENITIIGNGPDGKLDKNTEIYVNNVLHAEVHTSGSEPIGPGLVLADFTITYVECKDNDDPICPVDLARLIEEDQYGIRTISEIKSYAYPNPFMRKVIIEFILPEHGSVVIDIMDINGEVVKSVDLGMLDTDHKHTFEYSPEGYLSGGAYLYRIISDKYIHFGKMIFMK